MSHVFSTRDEPTIFCAQPELIVGFPRTGAGAPGTVVLANGAVVDRNVLGQIVSRFCPAIFCPQLPAGADRTVTLDP